MAVVCEPAAQRELKPERRLHHALAGAPEPGGHHQLPRNRPLFRLNEDRPRRTAPVRQPPIDLMKTWRRYGIQPFPDPKDPCA